MILEYVPKKKGQKSRLERELNRHYLGVEVTGTENDQVKMSN